MPRSKRYQQAVSLIDKDKAYPVEEAMDLVKKISTTRFDAGIEVHFKLGIDPKKGEQQVRGTASLPHGTGKVTRVAAFVMPDKQAEAKEAGADLVGGQDLIDEIKKTGKIDFDVAVASPEIMKDMAQIAKILGPKGLMPSPKNETVTPNVKKIIAELKKGKIAFKSDDTGNVHVLIGRVSFDDKQLLENFQALAEALLKAKPAATKGEYVKAVSINATMGPGIRVQLK